MHKMKEDYGTDEVTPYPTQVFSVNNWALKPNKPKEPPFTTHMLAICNTAKPMQRGNKSGSSKAPTGSKTSHSRKRKESSSAIDSNLSQPSVSTPIDIELHKEDQQATGGPTSLGVTSEERANPQLSSDFIIEAGLGLSAPNDSIPPQQDFIIEAGLGLSAPNDSIPPQQGMDERTKNTSYDHISGASSTAIHDDKEDASTVIHGDKEEASSTIKLEDLAKLVSQIQLSFKDLDSPEDDYVIIVDESDKDEPNAKTREPSVLRSSSLRSSQIQKLTNQVLILQSKKHKLELEKNKAEAKAALLKAQLSFPNVEQLNELLVKSEQTKFSKILSSHDFSSSFPTELKDLPSKFNELFEEVKGLKTQVYEVEIELPKELNEIPTTLEVFTMTVTSLTSQVAKLKTLQWELPKEFLSLPSQVASAQAKRKTLDDIPNLLLNVTRALDRRAEKDAEAGNRNQKNQQIKQTTPPTTTSVITTHLQSPPRSSSQLEGGHTKKDKCKKILSSEEAEKESTKSDSDDEAHVTGSMVESYYFVIEEGEHIHLTEEQIKHQKKLEEEAKARAAKQEGEARKSKLIDLLGCMDYCSDSEAEDGSDNGCLDCGLDSEAKDGSDNSMVVDEEEQDFTNSTDHQNLTSRITRLHSN
nr:hypothetical protein [Tanacetum cinerariifolium]